MRLALAVCMAFALLTGCRTQPQVDVLDPAERLRSYCLRQYPGTECAVACFDDVHADFAGDRHRLFRTGSLTKIMVAAAARRLAAKRKVDLLSPVTRYSRFALADAYRQVSLDDLMNHRSGMPLDFLDPWNPLAMHRAVHGGLWGTDIYASFESPEDFERYLNCSRTLSFLAARRPIYSNVGFALFAKSLEDATGMDLKDIIENEICRPYALVDTTFSPLPDLAARTAPLKAGSMPWLVRVGRAVPSNPLGQIMRGTGDLYSSTADYVRFLRGCPHLDSHLVERVARNGARVYYRFGMIYGGRSLVAHVADEHRWVIVLQNATCWPDFRLLEIAEDILASSAWINATRTETGKE